MIWDHILLPSHPAQVNTPRLNHSQTGWYSIYLPWRDGRLSWSIGGRLHTEMPQTARPQTITHLCTYPAVHGRESNSQPVDYKSDALTTTPPSQLSRAMLRHSMSSVCPSVRLTVSPSVTFTYRDHIGWKVISQLNSLRYILAHIDPQHRRYDPTGTPPKLRVEWGWGHEHKNMQYLWNGAR